MQQFSDVADEGAVAQRDIICQHVSRLGSKLPE
jgi:hypothetical protein